jgi:DNA-binding MarR family transcriptional regulator
LQDHVDIVIAQWENECPSSDVASMAVISRLFRLATIVAHEVDFSFKQHGLNLGTFDVLAALYRSGPPYALNPQRLTAALLLSSGAMTHRLDLLEAATLIERRPNPEDRRGVLVSLTPAGLVTVKQALADYLQELERLLTPLATPDRRHLALLLKQMLTDHDYQKRGGTPI